jgi:hypothetical protein
MMTTMMLITEKKKMKKKMPSEPSFSFSVYT